MCAFSRDETQYHKTSMALLRVLMWLRQRNFPDRVG